jgi:hypothetical protein
MEDQLGRDIVRELALLGGGQPGVEGRVDEAELCCGQDQVNMRQVVEGENADTVALADTLGPQPRSETIGALVELGVAVCSCASGPRTRRRDDPA